MGPGCRVNGEGIVLSVGRVKVPKFVKKVLQEGEEGGGRGGEGVRDVGGGWLRSKVEDMGVVVAHDV